MLKSSIMSYVKYLMIAVVVIGLVIVGAVFIFKKQPIIKANISNKISYVVYWPTSVNSVPQKNTIKFDSSSGVLSYVVYVSGVDTVVTEQSTPSEFSNFPTYYSTLINHLNNYDTFNTSVGNVYLTQPNNTSGDTAVINHSGTLLFAHAQSSIDENNWRTFFNNLKVILN